MLLPQCSGPRSLRYYQVLLGGTKVSARWAGRGEAAEFGMTSVRMIPAMSMCNQCRDMLASGKADEVYFWMYYWLSTLSCYPLLDKVASSFCIYLRGKIPVTFTTSTSIDR